MRKTGDCDTIATTDMWNSYRYYLEDLLEWGDQMNRLFLPILACAVRAFGSVATAADMPVKAPVAPAPAAIAAYNWTGFYIGAHGGGGWAKKCFTFADLDFFEAGNT